MEELVHIPVHMSVEDCDVIVNEFGIQFFKRYQNFECSLERLLSEYAHEPFVICVYDKRRYRQIGMPLFGI